MAAHSARITAGATLKPWLDPAPAGAPSRLNPLASHPHQYLEVTHTAGITITATLAGVEGPLDAALGGKLFLWSWVDRPDLYSISLVPTAGKTSELVLAAGTFTSKSGHYAVLVWRESSGGVIVPWEVIIPP